MNSKIKDLIVKSESGMYGLSVSAEEYAPNKIRFLRISDIDDKGNIINVDKKYVSGKNINQYLLKDNDLVVARTGNSTGRVYMYSSKDGQMVFAGFLIKYVFDKNKINPRYLKYYCQSELYRKQIKSFSGSTRGNMNAQDFLGVLVYYPERKVQDKLVKLFDFITNKIELNNKINDELEAMAKTIYDYWFLQFEFPNEEGKPYKSSGGKMVWNEVLKREIPEGWEVNKLEEYISIIRGVNYKRDDVLSNKETNYIPLIKSNNIQNGQILFDDIIFVPQKLVNKNQILSKNSVLMTMSSGSKEHMGKTTIIYDSLDYTFGAFCSKIEIIEDMRCFLSIFFRSALFKTLIDNITSGTNINNISNEHLYNIKMTIPNEKVLQKFEDILNPILDKQGIIQKENQELTSLRDFLLPLLMNGQVGFKEDKAEG